MAHFLTRVMVLLCCVCLGVGSLRAQTSLPEVVGENLLRIEGTDRGSGIHYVRYVSLLGAVGAEKDHLPRFTMECRELRGKRSLHWLVRFDGSEDFNFEPPPVALTPEGFPKVYPTTPLKMRFEGYMKSGEFKRQWEMLPTGELHYRNPGSGSGNLDDPRYFMTWLASLPDLRIGYAKAPADLAPGAARELVFPLKPLLDVMKKADFCRP